MFWEVCIQQIWKLDVLALDCIAAFVNRPGVVELGAGSAAGLDAGVPRAAELGAGSAARVDAGVCRAVELGAGSASRVDAGVRRFSCLFRRRSVLSRCTGRFRPAVTM